MGIRIDPTLEFVWRDPVTVQLGVDPPRAVVTVPSTAEERFLCALRRETGRDALRSLADTVRCRPEDAARVLGAASPAVVEVLPDPPRSVEVHGAGALADTVCTHLAGEGVTVIRTASPPGGPVTAPPAEPDVALAVADHVVDPALRAAWTRRDVPHIALVVGDGVVRLGPFVVPGDGPCLQCAEYERVDADPAWPAIAAQVWGRPAAELSPWRSGAVAAAATGLVLARLPSGTAPRGSDRAEAVQLVFDRADLEVRRRTVRPHPRCACRALPGTDSPPGPRRGPTPVVTT